MAVVSLQTVRMAHDKYIAVTASHGGGQGHAHDTVEGGIHLVAGVQTDVDTTVRTVSSELEQRGDRAGMRDAETMHRVDEAERHLIGQVLQ